MGNTIIEVTNLSKQYQLGQINSQTLSRDVNRWWARVQGKPDPYARIGAINDRTKKGNDEFVWALQNVNFNVQQGEVLGIIGRNGAGKSTLLKILSKVTKPTTGTIKIGGRIASLLEVGTGFHPEMTGRENVFMNGAILGMNKFEIERKFDEIVAFAGVEKYIDTPVKRYSSGMYVRLAFAVAAHLEPDILIVDEVLAVGDAEFQKKCLGRMKDVSLNHGRTVLFVSHNMAAIKSLCDKVMVMEKGTVLTVDETQAAITHYLNSQNFTQNTQLFNRNQYEEDAVIAYNNIEISQQDRALTEFANDAPIRISVQYTIKEKVLGFRLIFILQDAYDNLISQTFFDEENDIGTNLDAGSYETSFVIPPNLLIEGIYKINITSGIHNVRMCLPKGGITLDIFIIESGIYKRKRFKPENRGLLTLPLAVINQYQHA